MTVARPAAAGHQAGTVQGRTRVGRDGPGTVAGTVSEAPQLAYDQQESPKRDDRDALPCCSSLPTQEKRGVEAPRQAPDREDEEPPERASLSSLNLAWLHALLDLAGSGDAGGGRRLRQCPAHPDGSPSLSLRDMGDGVALHCFGGCATTAVLEALHCSVQHLFYEPVVTPAEHYRSWGRRAWPTFPPVVIHRGGSSLSASGYRWEADHLYGDDGRWKLERWRHPVTGEKQVPGWSTRDERGAYIPGLRGTPATGLPMYREREIRMAIGVGEPVVLCESESSVDALMTTGIYATTWAGGAGAPPLERLARVLAGAHVVLVPDHDEPGLECARRLWAALAPVVASLAYLLPDPDQDARDLLAARGPAVFTNVRPSITNSKESS